MIQNQSLFGNISLFVFSQMYTLFTENTYISEEKNSNYLKPVQKLKHNLSYFLMFLGCSLPEKYLTEVCFML